MLRSYQSSELSFAWSYVTYFRWKTHRNRTNPHLDRLDQPTLDGIAQRYGIRVLEANTNSKEAVLMASLGPDESVSTCVSKLKGQTTKWLREAMGLDSPARLLSRSYFACSIGKNTRQAVEAYLAKQPRHHGYADRARPPVFVKEYPLSGADEERLQPKHGRALIELHVCLSTLQRVGVFGSRTGEALADHWEGLGPAESHALRRISIVPDHTHLALRIHPAVVPSSLILRLMNSSQEFLFRSHREEVLAAKLPQIWHPGAYLGTYGDVEAGRVKRYIREWEGDEGCGGGGS